MLDIFLALVSCLPLLITSIAVVTLCWKSRGRIESLKIGEFEIHFGKGGRSHK